MRMHSQNKLLYLCIMQNMSSLIKSYCSLKHGPDGANEYYFIFFMNTINIIILIIIFFNFALLLSSFFNLPFIHGIAPFQLQYIHTLFFRLSHIKFVL